MRVRKKSTLAWTYLIDVPVEDALHRSVRPHRLANVTLQAVLRPQLWVVGLCWLIRLFVCLFVCLFV